MIWSGGTAYITAPRNYASSTSAYGPTTSASTAYSNASSTAPGDAYGTPGCTVARNEEAVSTEETSTAAGNETGDPFDPGNAGHSC